jgi:hypothetical protein
VFIEFRRHTKSIAIQVKKILIKPYNLVGKIKQYHNPLRRAYKIIYDKFRGTKTSTEVNLQITIKTINNSTGPNGIVFILLVFGAYPRMIDNSALSPIITKKVETIRKATKEIKHLYAKYLVINALAIKNSPNTTPTLEFPI